ncbi:hypothetical protein BJX99DRAFT_265597 [Aspergillus californicus]
MLVLLLIFVFAMHAKMAMFILLVSYALYVRAVDVDINVDINSTQAVHEVDVGLQGASLFVPNRINANIGDRIIFTFHSQGHTLTKSSLESPCSPLNGVNFEFSHVNGYDDGEVTFALIVNTLEPQWFFCQQQEPFPHCQAGMVFAINPGDDMRHFLHNAKTERPRNVSPLASTQVTPSSASTAYPSSASIARPSGVTTGGTADQTSSSISQSLEVTSTATTDQTRASVGQLSQGTSTSLIHPSSASMTESSAFIPSSSTDQSSISATGSSGVITFGTADLSSASITQSSGVVPFSTTVQSTSNSELIIIPVDTVDTNSGVTSTQDTTSGQTITTPTADTYSATTVTITETISCSQSQATTAISVRRDTDSVLVSEGTNHISSFITVIGLVGGFMLLA